MPKTVTLRAVNSVAIQKPPPSPVKLASEETAESIPIVVDIQCAPTHRDYK